MSDKSNRLQKPSVEQIVSAPFLRETAEVADGATTGAIIRRTVEQPLSRKITNETPPRGLTEIGMLDAEALTIAILLDDDRAGHAIVKQQLIKNGTHSLDEASRSETEFLQFTVLQQIAEGPVSPSEVADGYWHQFILNTALYTNWCQRNLGRYMHHRPEPRSVLSLQGIPEASSALFRKYFGVRGQMANCANGHDCHGNCTMH